jgi:hypothetical protein
LPDAKDKKDEKISTGCRKGAGLIIPVPKGDRGNKKKMMVYFMDTRSILRSFVIFYEHLVYVVRGNLVDIFPFWYFVAIKIWQPWAAAECQK